MKKMLACTLVISAIFACNDQAAKETKAVDSTKINIAETNTETGKTKYFSGALTGGMKGDSIFFDVDGNKLSNLTFKGYWRCNGKLEMQNPAGPEGSFTLVNGKVNDHISEPPNGGASAWRFDLEASVEGNSASGTFRMNINGLGCNTGTLKWSATAK